MNAGKLSSQSEIFSARSDSPIPCVSIVLCRIGDVVYFSFSIGRILFSINPFISVGTPGMEI
jgi:hypothetical protein